MAQRGRQCHTLPLCGCNSVVECQLPKLNVAGSNPVIRFNKNQSIFAKKKQVRPVKREV